MTFPKVKAIVTDQDDPISDVSNLFETPAVAPANPEQPVALSGSSDVAFSSDVEFGDLQDESAQKPEAKSEIELLNTAQTVLNVVNGFLGYAGKAKCAFFYNNVGELALSHLLTAANAAGLTYSLYNMITTGSVSWDKGISLNGIQDAGVFAASTLLAIVRFGHLFGAEHEDLVQIDLEKYQNLEAAANPGPRM